MRTVHAKRGAVMAAAGALAITGVWAFGGLSRASADATTTTSVSAGPATFTQAVPTGQPSQYNTPLERCANGTDHPISGPNPILSEPLNTSFTSNLPLSEYVSYSGDQYYGDWSITFTNTSQQVMSVDCAVIIWRAPSGSDDHSYANSSPYGHPQQDYLEVPRGDGTSYYIARLGFHDVPLSQREVSPGGTFTYTFGGAPSSAITLDAIRDSVRFTGDLDLSGNLAMIEHYGTNRLTN
jgi:hypothetical protein